MNTIMKLQIIFLFFLLIICSIGNGLFAGQSEDSSMVYARMAKEVRSLDIDSARKLANRGLLLALEKEDKEAIAFNYLELGRIYLTHDSIDLARKNLELAVENARASDNPRSLLNAWIYLGYVEDISSNYAASIGTYQEGMTYAERASDTLALAQMLNNMACVQQFLGEWSSALTSFEKAAFFFNTIGDYHQKGYALNNIGLIYYELSRFDSASVFYNQAKQIF
jgi:tetratricopeptide (TPR) repeat protein